MVGCNSRLDSIQAAILDIKLRHLDEYIDARRKAAAYYTKAFSVSDKLITPEEAPYSRHAFHQYTLQLTGMSDPRSTRDGLRQFLSENGIPAMIYYPVPGHRQKMFENFRSLARELPVTDRLTDCVISLPMHTELDEEQLAHITGKVLEYTSR